jgi:hypothetical protein
VIHSGNYSFHDWLKGGFAEDGDVFVDANLCQDEPGTLIGLKPDGKAARELLFRRCNLVNCVVPQDAKTEGCNEAQITKKMRAAWALEDAKARSVSLAKQIIEVQTSKAVLDAEIAAAIAKGVM